MAVVAEGFHGEAFRVASGFGTFGPGIAVGMEGDTGYAKPTATLLELSGPIRSAD